MGDYELKPIETFFGVLIVVGLVGLSLYFGQQQIAALRRLRGQANPPGEEEHYERRKARRRLVSCALTLLLAVLIAVLLATWDATFARVAAERHNAGPGVERTDEQRFLVRVWFGQWIAVLLVMLSVLVLAAIDVWATRRFAMAQFRKIREDRRAMIQGEVNRLRAQRNGEH